MHKAILTFIFILTLNLCFSQSLRQQLWDFASDCQKAVSEGYEEIFDKKPESFKDYCRTCIDDSGNGYLFIQGSWPTCGCSCHSEIGAYRKANGKYTLLKYESWPCSNSFGIYSNEKLVDVMPEYLSLKDFNSSADLDTVNYFHLDMEIPRVGTDTKVVLRLFPLGQIGTGTKGISFNTKNSKTLYSSLYSIKRKIINHLKDDNQIELILNGCINELPVEIKTEIESEIGENRRYKTIEELISKLSYIKNVYESYISLQYTEMTFSWNRSSGRFEIKDRSGKPKQMALLEFIQESRFFSLAC